MRPILFLFASVILSCSSTTSVPDASTDAGAEAGGDQTCSCTCGMQTGPTSMTCMAICGAACPALPPKTSNQLIISAGVFERTNSISVSNLFFLNAIANPGDRCYTQKIGACFAIDCTPGAGTLMGVSAGLVTLESMSTKLLQIAPGTNNVYPSTATNLRTFEGGDAITIAAAGDPNGVPKFDKVLSAPSQATLLTPMPDNMGVMTVDRSMDLSMTWTPITGGVTLTISQVPVSGVFSESRRILCELDGMAGSAMIPKAALAVLTTSASGMSEAFNFGGNATVDVTPGGYKVHVHAINATAYDVNVK